MSHRTVRPISLALLLPLLMVTPSSAQVPAKEKRALVEEDEMRVEEAEVRVEVQVQEAELRQKEARARVQAAQLRVQAVRIAAQAEALDDAVEELVAQPAFMFADENFDQWLYRDLQNSAGARSRLDALLVVRLEDVVQACRLTEVQRQKLQLAGRGDIKRFFDRVEELRRKFQLVKTDQNRIGEILQEIQPLQVNFQTGPFGDASIFAKTLNTTLTSEQREGYESAGRERRKFRYQACVELLVTKLDEALVMRAAQRRKFEQILLEETRPPVRFGPYDQQVVMLQAGRIAEDKLRPLFDERQWQVLTRQFQKVRELEPFLKSNGFLPDSPAGAVLAPAARVRQAKPVLAVPAVPQF